MELFGGHLNKLDFKSSLFFYAFYWFYTSFKHEIIKLWVRDVASKSVPLFTNYISTTNIYERWNNIMNNYQNPYFNGVGQMPYYPYTPYQNNSQPVQQPVQPTVQQPTFGRTETNYDFQGNYVKSYEEAKNAPYTDKTMVYLDTENDKIYIKRINEKGSPETSVYLITEPTDEIKTNEKNTDNTVDLEKTFKEEIYNLKREYDIKLSNMQEQIKGMKNIKGGK